MSKLKLNQVELMERIKVLTNNITIIKRSIETHKLFKYNVFDSKWYHSSDSIKVYSDAKQYQKMHKLKLKYAQDFLKLHESELVQYQKQLKKLL